MQSVSTTQGAKEECEKLALQRAAEGKSWRVISVELQGKGMERGNAVKMAQHATKTPAWYGRQWLRAGLGLLLMLIAVVIYFAADGGIIAYGLFAVGLWRLFTGLNKGTV